MILSFVIQNFKSILDITLSTKFDEGAAPNGYKDSNFHIFLEEKKQRVSPILSIYGANASGKSNIIKAIDRFDDLITKGIENTLFEPNKLNKKYENTKFAINFIFKKKIYEYSIAYNNKTIEEESLICNNKNLFVCKKQKLCEIAELNKYYSKDRLSEIFKIECKDSNQNQINTLLRILAKNYANLNKEIADAYYYLTKKVEICLEQPYSNYYSLNKLTKEIKSEETALNKINEITKKFDIDIENIFYEKKETNLKEAGFNFPYREIIDIDKNNDKVYYGQFYTIHKNIENSIVQFDIREESQGTQTVIPIIGVILATLEKGGVLFIDELDKSLHPLLLIQLTRLFKDKRYNKNNAQLIFTLHCTDLLEDELIRKSEIGIVSKNKKEGSTFIKLSKFKNLRNALDFRKRYLMGEFAGIPYAYI